VNWKRIVAWSALLIVLANGIGFLSGFILGKSEIHPDTISELIENHRLFRRIAIGNVAVLCYWRLGAGTPSLRAFHIFAAFLLVQLFDNGLALVLGAQFNELFEPWAMFRSILYAVAGYGLARLSPNHSFKADGSAAA